MFEDNFDFQKSIKSLATIDEKINAIVYNYESKRKVQIEDKKIAVSILNKIRYKLLDYYLDPHTINELKNKYQYNMDRILKKYSKDANSIDEIMNQIEIYKTRKNHCRKKLLLKE